MSLGVRASTVAKVVGVAVVTALVILVVGNLVAPTVMWEYHGENLQR